MELPRTGKNPNDQLDKLWSATAMPQRPTVWMNLNHIVLREKVRRRRVHVVKHHLRDLYKPMLPWDGQTDTESVGGVNRWHRGITKWLGRRETETLSTLAVVGGVWDLCIC